MSPPTIGTRTVAIPSVVATERTTTGPPAKRSKTAIKREREATKRAKEIQATDDDIRRLKVAARGDKGSTGGGKGKKP